jgi:hypothetical protein
MGIKNDFQKKNLYYREKRHVEKFNSYKKYIGIGR